MTKRKDLIKQIYHSDRGEAADTLQVCAAQVLGHCFTSEFTYPPAFLRIRQQVIDFRDLINVRVHREPLSDQANLALLRDIIKYLDKYRPEELSVIVTGNKKLGEVTVIHARPGPLPATKKDKPTPAEEGGVIVRLADYDHRRPAIRQRNLRAA